MRNDFDEIWLDDNSTVRIFSGSYGETIGSNMKPIQFQKTWLRRLDKYLHPLQNNVSVYTVHSHSR